MVYLHNLTDCVARQKIGLILYVKIMSCDTFRCCMANFSIISVGLCNYPISRVTTLDEFSPIQVIVNSEHFLKYRSSPNLGTGHPDGGYHERCAFRYLETRLHLLQGDQIGRMLAYWVTALGAFLNYRNSPIFMLPTVIICCAVNYHKKRLGYILGRIFTN
jgi:hypothetical protein